MVKLFSTEYTFKNSFDFVTSAFWRKYPNHKAPHIHEVDIFERYIDSDGNLVSKRLIVGNPGIPSWVKRVVKCSTLTYCAETSICSASEQKLLIKARNITGNNIMSIDESCTYQATPNVSNQTLYTQEALFTSFLPMISSRFEQYSLDSMHQKSKDGIQEVENLAERIRTQGLANIWDSMRNKS